MQKAVRMTLGDKKKKHSLDNYPGKDISAHRRKGGVGSISEGILCSFLESIVREGTGAFENTNHMFL